jgi:hypothetical protein
MGVHTFLQRVELISRIQDQHTKPPLGTYMHTDTPVYGVITNLSSRVSLASVCPSVRLVSNTLKCCFCALRRHRATHKGEPRYHVRRWRFKQPASEVVSLDSPYCQMQLHMLFTTTHAIHTCSTRYNVHTTMVSLYCTISEWITRVSIRTYRTLPGLVEKHHQPFILPPPPPFCRPSSTFCARSHL